MVCSWFFGPNCVIDDFFYHQHTLWAFANNNDHKFMVTSKTSGPQKRVKNGHFWGFLGGPKKGQKTLFLGFLPKFWSAPYGPFLAKNGDWKNRRGVMPRIQNTPKWPFLTIFDHFWASLDFECFLRAYNNNIEVMKNTFNDVKIIKNGQKTVKNAGHVFGVLFGPGLRGVSFFRPKSPRWHTKFWGALTK